MKLKNIISNIIVLSICFLFIKGLFGNEQPNHKEKLIKIHFERLNVKYNKTNRELIDKLCEFVGLVENNGKTISTTTARRNNGETTTAKGLYQFTNDSVVTAINRTNRYINGLKWYELGMKHKNMNKLSRNQQTLLFIGNLFEIKGSDKYLKMYLNGETEIVLDLYYMFHHTNKKELNEKQQFRIKKIYNKIYK